MCFIFKQLKIVFLHENKQSFHNFFVYFDSRRKIYFRVGQINMKFCEKKIRIRSQDWVLHDVDEPDKNGA